MSSSGSAPLIIPCSPGWATCEEGFQISVAEKIRRMDDVFATQPALLGAAVQLPSLGVDMQLAEYAFHVLLVLFECFSTYVPDLPKIGAETVQKAFDDLASMLRFYDGESPEEADRLQRVWATEHQRSTRNMPYLPSSSIISIQNSRRPPASRGWSEIVAGP